MISGRASIPWYSCLPEITPVTIHPLLYFVHRFSSTTSLYLCVEGGARWAAQVEGPATGAGPAIVVVTATLNETVGVGGVREQPARIAVAFTITRVYK